MDKTSRKAAIAAYKENKPRPGLYLITCGPTGERWAGTSPTPDTIRNRLWFTLAQGGHRNGALQQAWRSHGEAAFSFGIVERLPEDAIAELHDRLLRDLLARYCAETGAQKL